MAEKTEAKSGIQQQVEAGVQEANKTLLQSIKELLGISPKPAEPAAAVPAVTESPEVTRLKAELEKSQKALTELTTKTTELVTQFETDAKAKEKTKAEEVKTEANTKARTILAKAGHETVAAEKADSTSEIGKSRNDLWADYNKLTSGKEKRAFYLKHQDVLNS